MITGIAAEGGRSEGVESGMRWQAIALTIRRLAPRFGWTSAFQEATLRGGRVKSIAVPIALEGKRRALRALTTLDGPVALALDSKGVVYVLDD